MVLPKKVSQSHRMRTNHDGGAHTEDWWPTTATARGDDAEIHRGERSIAGVDRSQLPELVCKAPVAPGLGECEAVAPGLGECEAVEGNGVDVTVTLESLQTGCGDDRNCPIRIAAMATTTAAPASVIHRRAPAGPGGRRSIAVGPAGVGMGLGGRADVVTELSGNDGAATTLAAVSSARNSR
jgi:hypothetical protein